jgi:hypothetical protein
MTNQDRFVGRLFMDKSTKVVKVEGDIKFCCLIKILDEMFEREEWIDFTLKSVSAGERAEIPDRVNQRRSSETAGTEGFVEMERSGYRLKVYIE